MLYDKKKEVIEKYKEVLGEIGRTNTLPGAEVDHQIDISVAYNMLCEMARTGKYDTYNGVPSNFNWNEFKKDAGL